MSVASLKSNVLPGILSGFRGGALPAVSGITSDVQALALTAQALRFDRPSRPESFNVEDSVVEGRRVVPEAARAPIVRLVTEKRDTASRDILLQALAACMAANRLRVHPFDLATLEPFVEAYAADLGAEALAYAQRNVKAERKQSYFAPDSITDETWMLGNRGEKAKYIARRRAEDPALARQLVEDAWGDQDVDSRVRLAGALRVGVSADDKAFFALLLKDRSPRVRDVARGVLSRLPEYDGDNSHLKDIVSRIKLKEYGLPMMRRKEMRLEVPASVRHYGASGWVQENFAKIGIEEFAAAFEMTSDDIVSVASRDENMSHGVLVMAACSGAAKVVEKLIRDVLKDEGASFFDIDPALLEHLTQDERLALAQVAVRPESWSHIPVQALERVHRLIEGHMPEMMMQRILSSRAWRSMVHLGTRVSVGAVESLAIMCPPSIRSLLRAQLGLLDPQSVERANLFLEIIEHLESTND
jgi:hypothetical protein|nr:DUF5691 domain-containing protein [Neorhizobium tomejilense]